jgi:hypothetical protein
MTPGNKSRSYHLNFNLTENELPRSKLQGIFLEELIDLIEASFEEFDPEGLNTKRLLTFWRDFNNLISLSLWARFLIASFELGHFYLLHDNQNGAQT